MFKVSCLKIYFIIILLINLILISCHKDDYIPKPSGQVRLEYPKPHYITFSPKDCPFQFEYSNLSTIADRNKNCWYNFVYPKMKGTIYLSYSKINNNIYDLIKEAQKLVNEHKIKANSVKIKTFAYPEQHIYGNLYRLGGESASNIQFYITDSTNNFISGTLYFKVQPKPDSLRPAVDYIEKDIMRMIETTTWKK